MAVRRVPFDDPFQNPVLYADQGYDPYDGQGGAPTQNAGLPGGTAGPGPSTEPPPPAAPKKYGAIQGFDFGKLSGVTPHDSDAKYSDSVRGFSNFLGEGGQVSRGNLGDLEKFWAGQGHQGHAVGDDKFDFGDGQGPIDIINSKGEIWFQNGDDRFGGGGQAGPSVQSGNAAALGMGGGGSVGGSAGGGSSSNSSKPGFDSASLKEALAGLFPNGNFNQNTVNRRVDNVRGSLESARKSRLQTNQALLADRGLIGSGPEMTAYKNMDEDLFNQEIQGTNDAYAHESDAADSRMMQALQIAAGMTADEAAQAVNWFRAQNDATRNSNDFALGQGQLALGNRNTDLGYYNSDHDFSLGQGRLAIDNMNGVNTANLGMGRLALDRDALQHAIQSGDMDRLIEILRIQQGGASTSAGGYL
jgi:hypothetical protein